MVIGVAPDYHWGYQVWVVYTDYDVFMVFYALDFVMIILWLAQILFAVLKFNAFIIYFNLIIISSFIILLSFTAYEFLLFIIFLILSIWLELIHPLPLPLENDILNSNICPRFHVLEFVWRVILRFMIKCAIERASISSPWLAIADGGIPVIHLSGCHLYFLLMSLLSNFLPPLQSLNLHLLMCYLAHYLWMDMYCIAYNILWASSSLLLPGGISCSGCSCAGKTIWSFEGRIEL